MPAHIYIRVGRWNDAIERNLHAVHADEQYIAAEKPTGLYPLIYYPHNQHFLAFAATMAGRSQLALEHARAVQQAIPAEAVAAFNLLEPLWAYPYLTMVTFGKWDDVINEPNPPSNLRVATALAAYAKGVAHAAKGHGDVAMTYRDTVASIAQEIPESAGLVDKIVDVALHALMGEMAHRSGNLAGAEQHFRVATTIASTINYNEPPDWYYPLQQSLGAVLLDAGKPAEAEQLYRADLKLYPGNVWSLEGLVLALRAQNKTAEAAKAASLLAQAMTNADVKLTKSRF